MSRATMTPCEGCAKRYDEDAGDGFLGLCPECADLTDLPILESFSEDERRAMLATVRAAGYRTSTRRRMALVQLARTTLITTDRSTLAAEYDGEHRDDETDDDASENDA